MPFVGSSLKTKKLEQSEMLYQILGKSSFSKEERNAAVQNMNGKISLDLIKERDLDFIVLDKAEKIKASAEDKDSYILEKMREAGLSEKKAKKLAKRLSRRFALSEIRALRLNPMLFYETNKMKKSSAKMFSNLVGV